MDDRYSRQIRFQPIGEVGQEKINSKHVLIVGCGALGSANAESLVRAGIGKLTIVDRDYVEESNLQRQQLFTEKDVEEKIPKAIAAKKHLMKINHHVTIHAHVMDVTSLTLSELLHDVDLVIDATDNFDTRFILNDTLQQQRIPWIFGSCAGSTGMSFTIIPNETPCLRCLLQSMPINGSTCDAAGIIGPAVQMVVAHQTTEALKLLTHATNKLRANYLTFDLWNNLFQTIDMGRAKNHDCPTCGVNPTYPALDYQNQLKTEVLCGRDTVQLRRGTNLSLLDLAKRFESFTSVKQNDFLLSIEYLNYRIVFFHDGRTFIHGTNSITAAKKIYYQLVG
ncbi:Molybdopterin-synthase adenylyltransferase [Paraliobacillus sp. PM-2]|uniref:MoeB/ThiF family adenylyltransferase n=1 Tax=Paraliobacillus sp. PM-2 TaxID=1462524 RepID=UPI00061C5D1C|nr:MoeB/ThiF family adenylyltransferase [Paraliobacillus sp. PM-2]CQR46563.1 Molybdopterin-synthase adenylyltransferase [Paraliobacillus sp. PM-2]